MKVGKLEMTFSGNSISSFSGSPGSIRLEAKSEKGSRNHFWEDGMLTSVTHASY